MGCGISKSGLKYDLEEGETLTIQIKSISRRNEDRKEEFDSHHRKSVSSVTSEGAFLRKVVGLNEKERGSGRELEPNDRISIASSSLKENNLYCKQPHYLENLEKDDQFAQLNLEVMHKEEENIRPSNVEDRSSILLSPGSPSFRVYCAHDEYINVQLPHQDDGHQKREDMNKEMERGVEKSGRRGRRFRNAFGLRGGSGSLRRKTLLSETHKHAPPSTDYSVAKAIPKPSR
ncbi:hypothetical protein M5689_021119 [Euphorbia peplus]|nr:hypothetical protein M5689_021119 [Euphorbia peplus]